MNPAPPSPAVPSGPSASTAPWRLDPEARAWVQSTLQRLSLDDKLRQLFCLLLTGDGFGSPEVVAAFRPGSVALRLSDADPAVGHRALSIVAAACPAPLLVAGDLEGGANHAGALAKMPNALTVAAADDPELSLRMYREMARDARRAGYNWTFCPMVDLHAAFRSAIVGTRSYGSDPQRVLAHARAYLHAFQDEGIACTAKHWPGEGQDDRDQHLVATCNPQSMSEWEASYGLLYRRLIDDGVMSVMSAHIELPAWPQRHPGMPASLSAELTDGLLRDHLGFGGLVVSDASLMAGVSGVLPRAEAVVAIIAAGCDVLLFSFDLAGDLAALHRAVLEGRLSVERIDQAVRRQLEMKAALGLHRSAAAEDANRRDEPPPQTERLAAEVAARAVTLVKESPGTLPLHPQRHRRVVVMELPGDPMVPVLPPPSIEPLLQALRERGFEPRRHVRNTPLLARDADLLLYVLMQESVLTRGQMQLDWRVLHGEFPWNMQRWWHEVPTLMISFGHPCFLYEAPQVPTYINAYTALPAMQRAVVDKLTGATPFTGRSPVNPWGVTPPVAAAGAPSAGSFAP